MAIRNATARAALGFSSSHSRRETGAGGFLRYGLATIAKAVTAGMKLFAFALDGLAGNNERPKRAHYGWLCRSRGLFPMLFPSPTLYAPFFSCRTLLASILVVGTIISQEAAAAVFSDPPATPAQGGYKVERTTSLSLDQLKKRLKKFSIRIICWNPADQKAVIKVNNPATLSREQWRKVISESFANKLIVKKDNETIIYLLPSGISSNRVLAVTNYTAPTIDPFAEFDSKALVPVKSLADLPEIKLLQQLAGEEKKSGIYYERFVNPPNAVSAYYFKVEYVSQLQAMAPILEKSSPQSELEGFPSSAGVLEFIKSQTDSTWLQMRSKSGYLYLTTAETNAPLFTIQQNKGGQETIAMRSTMPNGTPFSYTIVKTDNTFTSITNLVSDKGPITLLDFATLGGAP